VNFIEKIPPDLLLPKGGKMPLFGKEGKGEIFKIWCPRFTEVLPQTAISLLTSRIALDNIKNCWVPDDEQEFL
jgi:hypothetical protein